MLPSHTDGSIANFRIGKIMKITALLENTTQREDMLIEHGLSLYIETENHKILFDMGQTDLFAQNAKTLGIDLSKVDIAILSHGHYDHGGGLATFLECNSTAPIYIQKDAFLPHYNGTQKYIGLDTSLAHHPRFHWVEGTHSINERLTLSDCNERERLHSFGSFGLTERVEDGFIPDDFRHEQYLLIEENGKRVLISGCSHKGILDLALWFEADVLIGGFHFSKLPLDEVLCDAAKQLNAHNTLYYTCHCTGEVQYRFMKEKMENLHYLSCGQTIEL